jgi:hypothetical protein
MNATILRNYKRERSKGILAKHALQNAKTRAEWYEKECGEHDDPEMGSVRLRIVPDECADLADLDGDTFNPKVNPEIPRARLEREQKEYHDKIDRDGVWGVIGEYYDGETWQHADSCFGFVGEDWKDSGYDVDIMQTTLDAANSIETCPTCGQVISK